MHRAFFFRWSDAYASWTCLERQRQIGKKNVGNEIHSRKLCFHLWFLHINLDKNVQGKKSTIDRRYMRICSGCKMGRNVFRIVAVMNHQERST